MRILDLFSGTGSGTQAFRDAGHEVISVEFDRQFTADLYVDITTLTVEDLLALGTGGRYDFVWASPPCQAFSVASIGTHWEKGVNGAPNMPKTEFASYSIDLVEHTVSLITQVADYYAMENPRGMLRKLGPVQELHRDTVWYCQYGDTRAKPTDLWNNLPDTWTPLACRNGAPDHESAPRGSPTGTQKLSVVEKSMIPLQVSESMLKALEDADE